MWFLCGLRHIKLTHQHRFELHLGDQPRVGQCVGEFFDQPHALVNHGLDAADAGRRFADDGEIAAREGEAEFSHATLQAFPLGDGGAGGGFFVRVGVAQDFDIVFAAFDDFAAVGFFAFGGLALGFGGVGLLRALS